MKRIVCLILVFIMTFGLCCTAQAATNSKAGNNSIVVTNGNSSIDKTSRHKEVLEYFKSRLNAGKFDTKSNIEAEIRLGIEKYKIKMTEKEIRNAVNLIAEVQSMGLEQKDMADQLDTLYKNNKSAIDNGTFSLEDIGIDDLGIGTIVKKTVTHAVSTAVTNTAKKVTSSVKDFFSGLFN